MVAHPSHLRRPRGVAAWFEALYPVRCVGCGAEEVGSPCPSCITLVRLRGAEHVPQGIEGAWALAPYAGPFGARVAAAKRGGDREALRALGGLLGRHAHDVVAGGWFDAVVPVPSPWTRRIRRGFGPGHVLAGEVARAARLPLWSVLSVAPGQRQSTLDVAARRTNLRGRLRSRPVPPSRLLLVDDVLTSGTTVAACAAELRARGAAGIWVLTLCDARRPLASEPASSE